MVGSPPWSGDHSRQTGDAATVDQVLTALGHHRRRAVIAYLSGTPDRQATVEDLVDLLAEEDGRTDDHVTRDQLAIQLHHRHLPRLADAGIVEYHRESGRLRCVTDDAIEELLACVQAWEAD